MNTEELKIFHVVQDLFNSQVLQAQEKERDRSVLNVFSLHKTRRGERFHAMQNVFNLHGLQTHENGRDCGLCKTHLTYGANKHRRRERIHAMENSLGLQGLYTEDNCYTVS